VVEDSPTVSELLVSILGNAGGIEVVGVGRNGREAIRLAKEAGCQVYDFWGAPDRVDPGDPMYGVYRFKEGFGAQFVQTIGAWDFPIKSLQYRLYKNLMPRLLSAMRLLGRARTRAQVDR